MKIENTDLRQRIGSLIYQRDFDEIGNLPGFLIFEKRDWREDTRKKFGCVTWLFNEDTRLVESFTENPESPEGYDEVEEPKEGDVITYFIPPKFDTYLLDVRPPIATHSGLYLGNGRVRSKFRESHVYEHSISAVPSCYGSMIKFFRKK